MARGVPLSTVCLLLLWTAAAPLFRTCTATCNDGYQFEDQSVSIVHQCDQFSVIWFSGPDVPACILRYLKFATYFMYHHAFRTAGLQTKMRRFSASISPFHVEKGSVQEKNVGLHVDSSLSPSRCSPWNAVLYTNLWVDLEKSQPNHCDCPPGFGGDQCQHRQEVCRDPPDPAFGTLTCMAGPSEAKTCSVQCQAGYSVQSAQATQFICDSAGTWTPPKDTIPNCVQDVAVGTTPGGPYVQPTGTATTPTTPVGAAMCVAWGQEHYRTFDNKVYTFTGACTYVLARDCTDNTFTVTVINDRNCHSGATCKRELDIYIGSAKVSLRQGSSGPEVTWDGTSLSVPTSRSGTVFQQVGRYLTVQTPLGFLVKWDGHESIFFRAMSTLKGKLCGLCGNYDGNKDNDFTTEGGTLVNYAGAFGTAWKRTELGEAPCPDSSQQQTCDVAVARRALHRCAALKTDPAFAACHGAIVVDTYLQTCKFDCCNKDEDSCNCKSMEAYSRACMDRGVSLNWRKVDRCPVPCSNGKVYQECGTACVKTCQNLNTQCSDGTCVDGCFCPPGTVQNGDQCVPPSQCPCTRGTQTYSNGATIQDDCNTCTCAGGKFTCTNKKCDARCSATGDPHYLTFDGKRFDFMGNCSYYLLYNNDFDIIVDNINCGHSEFATCTKSVTIDINGMTIKMDHNHQLFVNGREITQLPFEIPGLKVFMASVLFLEADLSNGVKILWDGRTRVYVTAPSSLRGHTQGLCGTFDNNQANDLTTRENIVENNPNLFGNTWKTRSDCKDLPAVLPPNPCETNAQRKAQAKAMCDKLLSDAFKPCHSVVAVQGQYEDCLYDMCSCTQSLRDCMCPTLASYADQCAAAGVILQWRLQIVECMIQCPGGQEYQVCGNPCESTCRNLAQTDSCKPTCVEGCSCPDGQALNDQGQCTDIKQCGCIFGSREFPAGYTTLKGTDICQCTGAKWSCSRLTFDNQLPPTIQPLCPDNSVYTDCVSQCPQTCDNLNHAERGTCTLDPAQCTAGCECVDGFVLEGDTCVNKTRCPCHHGGKDYYEGDVITMDCNQCICRGRRWECEKNDCPSVCSSVGESHYTTFDGKEYQFQGACDYVLVKSQDDSATPFQVTTENVACGTSGVTCSKMIEVTVGQPGTQSFYKLQLVRGQSVKPDPGSPFTVREVGEFVYIDTPFGLSIQWDKGTRVYVRLETQHMGKVEGLCGNFNGDQTDDFTGPTGGLPAAKATTFGDSWRVHQYCTPATQVADPCANDPQRQTWAQTQCSVISSDVFLPCHAVEPYQKYLDRCIYDSCGCDLGGDCGCLCTAIAAYAHVCATKGFPIDWRRPDLCPIMCDDCEHYSTCISACPKKTCDNRLVYDQQMQECGHTKDLCFEGCDLQPCPPGQVYASLQKPVTCIPEPLCETPSCSINGKVYREGERVYDDALCNHACEICNCRNGDLEHISFGHCETVAVPTVSPTLLPVLTPSGPTPMPPVCVSGWTSWMSASTPTTANEGDVETLEGLRKVYAFCQDKAMESIECRVVGEPTASMYSGQVTTCNLQHGFSCLHDQQANSETCMDYEVRFFCDCSKIPSVTPNVTPDHSTQPPATTQGPHLTLPPDEARKCDTTGWTDWFNSDSPDGAGDVELLPEIRRLNPICAEDYVTKVECRRVDTQESYDVTNDVQTVCNTRAGFACYNSNQATGNACADYEIRIYCDCGQTFTTPSGSSTPPTLVPVTVPYTCVEGWSPWMNIDSPTATRGSETTGTGDYELLWELRQYYSFCAQPRAIRCRSVRTQQSYHWNQDSVICELPTGLICLNTDASSGVCDDYEISVECDCGTATPTAVPSLSPSLTPSPGHPWAPVPSCFWTVWMNSDLRTPSSHGDYETIASLRLTYPFCEHPADIQCRVAPTPSQPNGTPYDVANQVGVTCDLNHGLVCLDSEQTTGVQCHDYQVRFYCVDACPTSYPPDYTVPPYYDCVEGWTVWMNNNSPTTVAVGDGMEGDFENLTDLPGYPTTCYKALSAPQPTSALPPGVSPPLPTPTPGPFVTPVTLRPNEVGFECNHGWTPMYNSNTPGGPDGGDLETFERLRQVARFCNNSNIVTIECVDLRTGMRAEQTGEKVACDKDTGFTCYDKDQADGTCADYGVRFYCDCYGNTVNPTPPVTKQTPHPSFQTTGIVTQKVCDDSLGVNQPSVIPRDQLSATSVYDAYHEAYKGRLDGDSAWMPRFMDTTQWLQVDLGRPEQITGIVTQGHPTQPFWVTKFTVALSLDGKQFNDYHNQDSSSPTVFETNVDNAAPVHLHFDRQLTAQFVRIQPSDWKNNIALRLDIIGCSGSTTITPTVYPPWYTGETPTAYPPGYTGETPTAYPPGYTGETPTAFPPGYTGVTPTAYPPGYTGVTPTAYPPGYTGETPTAFPPWYTGETPTAYPPGYTGETPTAYPPGYTGEKPTAYPPGYTGETPTAYPPGYTGVTPTAYPPGYTGETPTAYPPGYTGETPTAYPPWYTGETPTAYPPGYTGETPTAYPPGYTGETPTAYPPGYTGETPTAYPPGYTGETPTAYPPGYTGETPTAYPPGYTGETPTAYPPGYTGETPTAFPPGYTGETPTAYPPGYTGETPTAYPPGYTGVTPTAYPPGYTGETPTAYPPGYTGEIPTAFPPGYTGETPTAYPPGYTGETPTAYPPGYTGVTPTAYPPGYTGVTPTAYPPGYTGETPTAYPPGYTGVTPTAYPPGYTGETPTAYPPGYTGETPTAFPPGYTGVTPTAYPPGYTGETPTAFPPWYTGETPTAFPPGYTGETPTAFPPGYTGVTPTAYPPEKVCNVPMTINNVQKFKDSQMTSSSFYRPSTAAYYGRLDNDYSAWVPKSTDDEQWLQLDLGRPKEVAGILTQGSPYEDRWTTSFFLRYSNDSVNFHTYSSDNPRPLTGNQDRNTVVRNVLHPLVTARYWRLVPTAWGPAGIAVRLNLLGCELRSTTTTPSSGITPTAVPTVVPTIEPICVQSMGLENYQVITDNQFTSSSSLDEIHGAAMSRLTTDYSSMYAAWRPASADQSPWVQVDFLEPKLLSGVLMQGRWPAGFHVQHSMDGVHFEDYIDAPGAQPRHFVAQGYGKEPGPQIFNRNIIAQYVRVVPVDVIGDVEVKFNVLGCNPSQPNTEVTTVSPPSIVSETPTAHPPGHTGETPTAYPPGYTGETPTAYPPGYTGETPTAYPPGYTGETPAAFPPGYTVCLIPMGLQSRYIVTPDQMTASSSLNLTYNADNGRVYNQHTGETGGAWIPGPESQPWIQVDLKTPKLISGVVTQGSPDTARWVSTFTLEYSLDGVHFTPYSVLPGQATSELFTGNTDPNTPVRNLFNRNVIAQFVRLHPVGPGPEGFALRFEILGCKPDTPIYVPPNWQGFTPTPFPPDYTGETPTAIPPGYTGQTPTAVPPDYTGEIPEHLCNVPMGLTNPDIVSSNQLQASSVLDVFHSADRARIYTQKDGPYSGGWQPRVNDDKQWIEVDFLSSYSIGGVITQGSADSDNWVTKYEVYYSNDGQSFYPVIETAGGSTIKLFSGNNDRFTPVMHLFPLVHARYIQIRPLDFHGAIALRFNIFGCQSPSFTPLPHISTGTPMATPTAGPQMTPDAGCVYWSPWVNTNAPAAGSEFENVYDMVGLVGLCDPAQVIKIECRVASTHLPWDVAGQPGVTCDLDQKMLLCVDTPDSTCFDYEIRVLCDECPTITTRPPLTTVTPPPSGTCVSGWSNWYDRDQDLTDGDFEGLSQVELASLCPGGVVEEAECNSAVDNQPYYLKYMLVTTCDVQTGFKCDLVLNSYCENFKIRYRCQCKAQPYTCTNGWTDWINQDSPDTGDGDLEKLTDQEKQQLCPGGQLVEIECETTDGIKYYSSGEIVTCDLNTGLVCSNGDNSPIPCSDYQVRYRCKCLEVPTAYPPGYTGYTPTAQPYTCTNGWTDWINQDSPDTGDGDLEKLTDQEKQQLCPGGQLVEIECETTDGIKYYSSGEIVTCDLNTGLVCSNGDNSPIPCSDYQVRYRCKCLEVPTAYPPGYTGQTPPYTCTNGWTDWINQDSPDTGDGDLEKLTDQEKQQLCPGGQLVEIECETTDGIKYYSSGEIVSCDLNTGLVCNNGDNSPIPCSDYQVRYRWYTPTAQPYTCTNGWTDWINQDSPDTGDGDLEKLTDQEKQQLCPGGQLVEIECETTDGIKYYSSGEIVTCDLNTGLVCSNGDNSPIPCSDYQVRYRWYTPTAQPYTCTNGWTDWINQDSPDTGDGDLEKLTDQEKQQLCPGGQLVETECETTDGIKYYSSGEIVTCDLNTGLVCSNGDNSPIPCSDYQVRYRWYTPTAQPYTCTNGWTDWINQDSPDTGDGDLEKLTDQEKQQLCPGGQLVEIECETTDGIKYYSSGEIVTCDLNTGLVCSNGDNSPIPCSDYQVRYRWYTPTAQPYTCTNGWTDWINQDSPDTGDGDLEKLTDQEKQQLCPGGQLVETECETTDGIKYYSSGEIVTCDLNTGLVCSNGDNSPIPCSDYQVRYRWYTPTAQPYTCTNGWTDWINQDSPDTGDGDLEKLTDQEKQQLCPGGQLVEIECETTDGIKYYSSGEIVTCDLNTGLVCSNGDNSPIPCSDYQVRYRWYTPTAQTYTCTNGWTDWINQDSPDTGDGDLEKLTDQEKQQLCPGGQLVEIEWYTPTAQPYTCTNGWTDWINQDSPDTGDGDLEKLTDQEKQQLCPGGQLVEIECETTDGIKYYSSGEIVTCDLNTGLVCSNGDNSPIPCSDYQVRYRWYTPTAQPYTCTNGWTDWINQDSPDTGDGDLEKLTDQEKQQLCPGGQLVEIECETTDGIKYYSSGEIVTCDLNTGLVCSNGDNSPIPCSDYKVRYRCKCSENVTSTSNPVVTPYAQSVPPSLACPKNFWTRWINKDSPTTGDGDHEVLTDVERAVMCGGQITDIQCYTTGDIPSYSSGEILTCDLTNGLVCNNNDNFPVPCSDYQIRYFCQCDDVTTVSPTFNTNAPKQPIAVQCAWSPWLNADSPDSMHNDLGDLETIDLLKRTYGLCPTIIDMECRVVDSQVSVDAAGQSQVACDAHNGLRCYNREQGLSSCYDYEVRVLCWSPMCTGQPPSLRTTIAPSLPQEKTTREKRLDANTCVAQEMCPCMKPDSTKAMPYETWKNPDDSCSDCSCHNGAALCTNHDPSCSFTTTPGLPSDQLCGWSQWMNTDSPLTGSGDIENLAALRSTFRLCDSPVRAECRDVITHQPAPSSVTCDVTKGLMCLNVDQQGRCADYEIRIYCPCANSTAPASDCVSGWSAWINKDTPDTGDGDVEMMTSSELTSFCPGGTITQVDCQTADGIEYYSSGEILTCTTDGGLQCNNADNFPIPCSDYKIQYLCSCPASTAAPTTTTMEPTTIKVEPTTAATNQVCVSGWSAWINKDTPDTGDGDMEKMTSSELTSFCPGGTITQVDCQTADGIEYYSSGEILTCTTDGGLQCNNADNFPIPCSDYKIKYLCSCPASTAAPTTVQVIPTAAATSQVCVSGWSAWINKDAPDTGDGDVEKMTSSELTSFCPGGTITQVDCQTADGIEYYSSGEILTCTTDGGLQCNNADNFPIPCSDYKIKYLCSCPASTVAPTTVQVIPTSAATSQVCVSGWSAWINKDTPDTGDGDMEKMTSSELTSFCPGGTITQVDCQTADGIKYYSSGEILTCTTDGGLQCNNADNFPIPCSDYKIKYLCSCPASTAAPTTVQVIPTAAATSQVCVSGWSAWINKDTPDTGNGDVEKMTSSELTSFCPGGTITQVDCQTADGIEYYSSGEILTCTTDGGLQCNNADNFPIPCSDYKIKYLCSCPALTVAPTTVQVIPTSAATSQVCDSGWSAWINKDTPDTGNGDMEKMTSSELTSFCPGGTITQVDCQTADGIEYYSSGEILTCTTDGGLQCNNADNFPIPCSDYKIKYLCSCPASSATPSPTTVVLAPSTAVIPACHSGWSAWINRDSPDAGDGDHEQMTASELAAFCPGGSISKINCQTADGIEYYSSGEILTCTTDGGLQCNNADNFPIPCSDYKIQYLCSCPASSATPTPTTVVVAPSSATVPACHSSWSAWINRDSPDAGDGDHEQMTASELAAFCPGGSISKINCQTVDGIEYYSSGEILTCTTDGGLQCNNADNFPIPCSDYKIQYECTCHVVNNDEGPTVTPAVLTTCGWTPWMNGHHPSADGEIETISALRKGAQFCASPDITAIQCQLVDNQTLSTQVQAVVTCDLRYDGLVCRQQDQPAGITCPDFQVRFLCEPRGQDCGDLSTASPHPRPLVTLTLPSHLPDTCLADMGMVNGYIRDDMISASSSRDLSHSPQRARLNGPTSWLPARDDSRQFLQVDLLAPRYVTGLTTQGRDDAPLYVTSYRFMYSMDGVEWNVYREESNVDKILTGNNDSETSVQNLFAQPIRARYVRINPVTWHGRIALRFELHGCFEAYPTEGCVEWDMWLDLHQPGLTARDDRNPISLLQAASPRCVDPVLIQCRTATPDKTPWQLTGQHVRCNLWDGLVCTAEEVDGGSCYNYEARLGCLKQTLHCLSQVPTATPTAQPQGQPVPACYPGMDRRGCPVSCPPGQLCDGVKCVPRSECPCSLDNTVVRARDIRTNARCETCQCLNGEMRCVPKTCGSCSKGVGHLNSSTCNCECLTCTADHFQCNTGTCILLSSRCDGVIDCQNDELDCDCPRQCPEAEDPVCPQGSQLVEIMEACNCTRKACMTTVKPVCRFTHSVRVSNGLDEEHTTPMDAVYQPGETWRDGACKTCGCMLRGDGSVSVSCQQQRCPVCQPGEKRVAVSGECCGQCRPTGCVVNGTVYQEGEVIPGSSSCYRKTCQRDVKEDLYFLRETQRQCPHIDTLPPCLHDYDSYDDEGCCRTCVPKTMLKTSDCGSCTPRALFPILRDSIAHFQVNNSQGSPCHNAHPIPDLTQCAGQCASHSRDMDLIGRFDATCSCCQPISVSQRHVTLKCEDGTSLEHSYTVPDACQCGPCTGGQ
ncbi:uncharacterized protein LOC143294198 [Babylonia areolata]|uniref:uncharacterized protein LOC143294198 n=1 Tax=Babylonia areolata TaxID=304850 RepID=UPI003FD5D2A9